MSVDAEDFVRIHWDTLAPEHLDRAGALMFRLVGGRFGDYRDWAVVDDWAGDIATALGPES
jgi:menaquinone-dependent protoporphyrinogen oxidase